jgi:SAM-dependent methyltransferase
MNVNLREKSEMEARAQREACPICSSPRRDACIQVQRKGERWQLVECECGFVYCVDPRRDTTDGVTPGTPKSRHYQIARVLETLLPERARILEIGAGNGALASLLVKRFDYEGFEPGAARPELSIRAEFFQPHKLGYQVSAVVLDNVLEHVLDPAGLLEAAAEALLPNGYLIILVPNRNDLRRLHPGWRRRRHWIPPDHINYFSRADLKRLLGRFGFKIEPFGWRALRLPEDLRFAPRVAAEQLGVAAFGHNIFATRP